MIKVITYGTYDVLHHGHIKLLERAKALGDYLIVGVTSDDYDKTRGKINNQQSLVERIAAVKKTGIADEIIVEEYEGQKIEDIRKYNVDIFTVGSDWEGYFDYLEDYCKVIYLPRTEGVSSSRIRDKNRSLRLGMVGDAYFVNKVWKESKYVNGIHIDALCSNKPDILDEDAKKGISYVTNDFEDLLSRVDAVYIRSYPYEHYDQVKKALSNGKHVLCESPITMNSEQCKNLFKLAEDNSIVLMEAIKTAYAIAYSRLLLLVKTGKIGEVISIDSSCTSLRSESIEGEWNSIHEWGPTALLPVLQVFGTDYLDCRILTRFRESGKDGFTRINLVFSNGCSSSKVGDAFKSEGDLIITGSKGYIYVPSPWWKTDYFEIRYEDLSNNKRYFYQLEGEGIRYELVAFARAIEHRKPSEYAIEYISKDVSIAIARIMESFEKREKLKEL